MMDLTIEEIDDDIRILLMENSGDGHIDGHEEITTYIGILLKNGIKLKEGARDEK